MSHATSLLPTVQWGPHRITRLLVGHNPVKGISHYSQSLSSEMREWYDPERGNDIELLRRCEECGINTAQFGGEVMHDLLRRYRAAGGHMQWIATLYDRFWADDATDFEEELRQILAVDPRPIGIQMFGENTDRHFIEDRMGDLREKLKRVRDAGVLVGVGTHLPEVIEVVESEGWDVDFYQCCFYTVYTLVDRREIRRGEERYDDRDRERMANFVRTASQPCIAFKILGANRKCDSDESVAEAFRFAFDHLKETDVVLVGMWQKYKDQVAQNAEIVRRLLAPRETDAAVA